LKNINGICLLPYNILSEYKIKKFNKKLKINNYTKQSNKDLIKIKEYFKSDRYQVKIGG
jgi:hypothetical protein